MQQGDAAGHFGAFDGGAHGCFVAAMHDHLFAGRGLHAGRVVEDLRADQRLYAIDLERARHKAPTPAAMKTERASNCTPEPVCSSTRPSACGECGDLGVQVFGRRERAICSRSFSTSCGRCRPWCRGCRRWACRDTAPRIARPDAAGHRSGARDALQAKLENLKQPDRAGADDYGIRLDGAVGREVSVRQTRGPSHVQVLDLVGLAVPVVGIGQGFLALGDALNAGDRSALILMNAI